jgi:hypothetical protein
MLLRGVRRHKKIPHIITQLTNINLAGILIANLGPRKPPGAITILRTT